MDYQIHIDTGSSHRRFQPVGLLHATSQSADRRTGHRNHTDRFLRPYLQLLNTLKGMFSKNFLLLNVVKPTLSVN